MQLVVSITLSISYVGLSLLLGGLPKNGGFIWWFFVPCFVMVGGGLIAKWISTILPIPWQKAQSYNFPPRRIRLSWRTAIRIPAWMPLYLILWHFISISLMHFAIGPVLYIIAPLLMLALACLARKCRREMKLLREGWLATGIVEGREDTGGGLPARIFYSFVAPNGTPYHGRAWDLDYGALEGSSVPIYYDANNPENHIAATTCWFEADCGRGGTTHQKTA